MKIMTLAAIGALALAVPAFAQIQPVGPGGGAHGGARDPMGSQPMDEHRGGDMGRAHDDGGMSGREGERGHPGMNRGEGRGMQRTGYDGGRDYRRGGHDRGYGRHCQIVWHHHHRTRRCN